MVDHDLDRRGLDTGEQFGDAPLFKGKIVGEYLDAGADQGLELRGLGRRPRGQHRILNQ